MCPDKSICSENTTCCEMSDKWYACCPIKNVSTAQSKMWVLLPHVPFTPLVSINFCAKQVCISRVATARRIWMSFFQTGKKTKNLSSNIKKPLLHREFTCNMEHFKVKTLADIRGLLLDVSMIFVTFAVNFVLVNWEMRWGCCDYRWLITV